MIKVAAHWEIGWNTPMQEESLWHYPLRDFGVEDVYMIPVSGIKAKFIHERHELKDVLAEFPELQVVYVSEIGETMLSDFVHPENVLYVVGRTGYEPIHTKKEGDLSVRVETKLKKSILWGHQAMSIVLYDRLMKENK